mmetsp:Transcript_53892/g.118172  ORF Transcript_53892/g.118172 Transcript_53892/m.118172 type:complete len:263 (-) Transcript_53892:205-993(-)
MATRVHALHLEPSILCRLLHQRRGVVPRGQNVSSSGDYRGRNRSCQRLLERSRSRRLLEGYILCARSHHHVLPRSTSLHRSHCGVHSALQEGGLLALSELDDQCCCIQVLLDDRKLSLQRVCLRGALTFVVTQRVLTILDVALGLLDTALGLYDPLLFVGQLGAQPTQISNDNILRHCILVLELLTLHHRDVQLGDLPLHHAIDNTTRVVQFVLGQALGSVTLVLAQGSKHTLGNLVPHVLEHRLQGDAVHGRVEMGSLMLP